MFKQLPLCMLGLCAATFAQTNEQSFYNASLFSQTTATRATVDAVDQIYFSQPVDFRRSTGKASGWRVILQDQDPRTAESVRLSYHNLDFQSIRPLKAEVAAANFTAFGSGSAGARSFVYTFTTASELTIPEFAALGIRMPKPNAWPADALTIHFQRGDRTQVAAADRQQWTYKLDNLGNVADEWRVGSTFRFGGVYKTPVLQAFNGSNAYSGSSSKDDLFGPESIAFATSASRSDTLGFRGAGGSKYATVGDQLGVAALYFAADYRPAALPLAPFGTLLVDENSATFLAYMVLDNAGFGRTLTVEVPTNLNLKLAWQAFFVAIDTSQNSLNSFELSNGVRTTFE